MSIRVLRRGEVLLLGPDLHPLNELLEFFEPDPGRTVLLVVQRVGVAGPGRPRGVQRLHVLLLLLHRLAGQVRALALATKLRRLIDRGCRDHLVRADRSLQLTGAFAQSGLLGEQLGEPFARGELGIGCPLRQPRVKFQQHLPEVIERTLVFQVREIWPFADRHLFDGSARRKSSSPLLPCLRSDPARRESVRLETGDAQRDVRIRPESPGSRIRELSPHRRCATGHDRAGRRGRCPRSPLGFAVPGGLPYLSKGRPRARQVVRIRARLGRQVLETGVQLPDLVVRHRLGGDERTQLLRVHHALPDQARPGDEIGSTGALGAAQREALGGLPAGGLHLDHAEGDQPPVAALRPRACRNRRERPHPSEPRPSPCRRLRLPCTPHPTASGRCRSTTGAPRKPGPRALHRAGRVRTAPRNTARGRMALRRRSRRRCRH